MIFIYIVIALIVILAILSLVLPDKFEVEKTKLFTYSATTVFNNVADLTKYHEWNPWQKEEPTAKHYFAGTAATIGHKYSWEGKKIGVGSLTLESVELNKKVSFEMNFIKPFKSEAKDSWIFEAINDNECKVTWINSGKLSVGIPRLIGPMLKSSLNKQFDQGLANLKAICATG